LAAIAAGVSAWSFYGQLTEMQKAGADTRDLARAAKDQAGVAHDTLVMSERPCLYIDGDIKVVEFGSKQITWATEIKMLEMLSPLM
jgi:hypothetical protein